MDVYENFPLLHHNTFAVEAKAARFVEYCSVKELKEAIVDFGGSKCGFGRNLFVGQGSNLLFTKEWRWWLTRAAVCLCRQARA